MQNPSRSELCKDHRSAEIKDTLEAIEKGCSHWIPSNSRRRDGGLAIAFSFSHSSSIPRLDRQDGLKYLACLNQIKSKTRLSRVLCIIQN